MTNGLAGQHNISSVSKSRSGAYWVALGIFLSRIAGLVRESVFAHFFGSSMAADAFKAALKIPNFLQNLFGEGVLSASFIPVYARLLAQGDEKQASRVAGVIGSLLALCTSILVLFGVLATPYMIDLIAPGFTGEKRLLTIQLVQIFFPGTGLLVMSAWCLGILNSHHRFFLSYVAPVLWNIAIIAALLIYGHAEQASLAKTAAWGLAIGSVLQFGVQVPVALRLLKNLPLSLDIRITNVRTILQNFVPVVIARGVVQISAYIDNLLASFLPTGAVANLAYAQVLYLLPVSLFGMSVSAANLPVMSSTHGQTPDVVEQSLRQQLEAGLAQIAYFIVPSAAAFIFLGDVIISVLFQTGTFQRQDTLKVWAILAGSTVGLLAGTMGRLYSSTFYAMGDTRTPLRCAVIRVVLVTGLGYVFALQLPHWFGFQAHWGAPGLTISAGLAGWVEFHFLRHYLQGRIGQIRGNWRYIGKLWLIALLAAGVAWLVKVPLLGHNRLLVAVPVLASYGFVYLGLTSALKIGEAGRLLSRLKRRFSRGLNH